MNLVFFKTKKFYAVLVLVVAVGGYWYWSYQKSHQPAQYVTVKVERGDLKQTVEAVGKVESPNDLSLRFEIPGTLDKVSITEGSLVKTGDVLATLRLADLDAAYNQAKANLDQKLAGATDEDKLYYAAAMDSAKATWDQSIIDADNSVKTAQSAVDTAKNNLKLAEGGESSQIVTQAYQDAATTVQVSLSKLDDALTQADNILGIDNTFANESFKSYLSVLNLSKLTQANSLYLTTKTSVASAHAAAVGISVASPHPLIDTAMDSATSALNSMDQLLSAVSEVLRNTAPVSTLTQASLDAKKTTIETTRSAISAQLTSIVNQAQSVSDAKNSYSTYDIAYKKALNDLDQVKANASSSVKIKEAAYNQAVANYQSKIKPPREVDVASLRAALTEAVANRNKAIIRAPIDGIITQVNKKQGESVTGADAVIRILEPHYEVKVDIPETDVAKLKINDQAEITMDAFGSDLKFKGVVIAIDPGSTEVQDVVYYKVTVSLVDSDKPFKPGMTANVSVATAERQSALYVPLRIVRTRDDKKYVRILENGQEREVPVELGLRANDGKVEVLSGLSGGEEAIIEKKVQ